MRSERNDKFQIRILLVLHFIELKSIKINYNELENDPDLIDGFINFNDFIVICFIFVCEHFFTYNMFRFLSA